MSATALPPLARKQPDRRAQARSVGSSASSSSVRLPPIGHAHGSRQVRSDRLGSGGGGISVGNVQITLQELTKPADSFDSIQRDLVDLDLSRYMYARSCHGCYLVIACVLSATPPDHSQCRLLSLYSRVDFQSSSASGLKALPLAASCRRPRGRDSLNSKTASIHTHAHTMATHTHTHTMH
eukprot:scpid99531/ scgid16575/ 